MLLFIWPTQAQKICYLLHSSTVRLLWNHATASFSVDRSLVPLIRNGDTEATCYIQLNSRRRLMGRRFDGPHNLHELCVQEKTLAPVCDLTSFSRFFLALSPAAVFGVFTECRDHDRPQKSSSSFQTAMNL